MKKRIFVILITSLFLIVAPTSNAEMKIAPGGITTPDDSAALHLSGIFATRGTSPAPYGAVISGVNNHSDNYFSCGGYFSALGAKGVGVYGSAEGKDGKGVYGYASGSDGFGVYGQTSGSGPGVFGKSSLTGVQGYSSGNGGAGIHGSTGGSNGRGVLGSSNGIGGIGVYGDGTLYDFYAAGGKIGYGPFTGAHEVKFAQNMQGEITPGTVVSVTGKAETRIFEGREISLSSTMPTVKVSSKVKDKAVFGIIVSEGPLPNNHWYKAEEGERFGVVNALGEGRVWVTNRNGNIEAGDYITTSDVPGYGQLQDDNLLHSYTLGKAIETIDWDGVAETVQHDGQTYKRYLLAVVYTSG
jgi:hypothetical protein